MKRYKRYIGFAILIDIKELYDDWIDSMHNK